MSDFIFEDKIEFVKNKHTQEYLKEVLSTYYNKEYRSCIIVLYAAIFTDLLEKFKLLSEYYNDSRCEKFLETYIQKRNQNTKYSELENDVIEFAVKTGFLNDVERNQISHLKDYRDYCAHPVVCESLQLISPSKEQVRAQIRNMFETIFLKDAIINNNICDEFLSSVQGFFDRNGVENLDEYLKSRYLSRLEFNSQKKLIKDLWKFLFYYPQEEDCKKYREIIYSAFVSLYRSNESNIFNFMTQEAPFFNGKIAFEKVDVQKDCTNPDWFKHTSSCLILLLYKLPKIASIINTANMQEVKNNIYKNANFLLMARYLFSSSREHIDELNDFLTKNSLNCCINSQLMLLVNAAALENFDTTYQEFIIDYFKNRQNSSVFYPDFDYINCTYTEILSKVIETLTEEQIKILLSGLSYSNIKSNTFREMVQKIYDTCKDRSFSISFDSYDINIEVYVQK